MKHIKVFFWESKENHEFDLSVECSADFCRNLIMSDYLVNCERNTISTKLPNIETLEWILSGNNYRESE